MPRRAGPTVALTVSVGLGMTGSVLSQDNPEEAVVLDRVQVTGSRIKRVDTEGALPVTIIDREQIELSGESSAAELLRSLTFNSFGSFRPQSGSSRQGTTSLSLRGIGSSRTLVLIDGRRMPKSPATGNDQDLSLIPLGAIERIEVLSDGASAIYGSDAIGGVVNIVTRSDFVGAELMVGAAEVSIPTEGGGDREEGSFVFGARNESTSVVGGVSWNNRDIVFAREFPWNPGGITPFSNNFTTLSGGFDNFNWTAFPNGLGCDFANSPFSLVPTPFSLNGLTCSYDFTLVSADEASTGVKSLYVKGDHQISRGWRFYFTASLSESESFGRYAPVPDSSTFFVPLSSSSPNNPTNPSSQLYDPAFGPPTAVNWWHRFDPLGPRDTNVLSQLDQTITGVTGYLGSIEWDFGLRRSNNRSDNTGDNYLLRSAAAEAIESGAYNLADPYSASESLLDSLRVRIARSGKFDEDEAYLSAAFDILEVPAGPVQAFLGAERREQRYSDQYDPLSEAGLVGGSAGNSAGANREISSGYFEVVAPISASLEATFAGRYDRYSDYGSDFSPKASVRWRVNEDLVIRGSVGDGFRAPTLNILSQSPATTIGFVKDPQTCVAFNDDPNCDVQIFGTITSNPNLDSEKSTQFSLGFVWEPSDLVNLSIDYYDIEIDDLIEIFSFQDIVDLDSAGDPIPRGLSVTRNPDTGVILEVVSGPGNEGDIATSGVDLNAMARVAIGPGELTSILQLSWVLDYVVDGLRDRVDDPGLPEARAILSHNYEWGDWTFVWITNHIAGQCDDIIAGQCVGNVPSWSTNDLQINFHSPWDGRFTLGVQNVAEKEPPLFVGDVGARNYDFGLYHGYGRIPYLRYTQAF